MPPAAAIALAALGGALIGSFLNVVAHRLPRDESLVRPRSRCPECGAEIAAYDNVPVLSWLFLRGRCRHCGARISPRYPALELATAVVFGAIVAVNGADDDLLLELPFAACLVVLAAIDVEHRLLPNKIVYPMAAFGLVAVALVDASDLPEHLIAGAAAFTALLLIVLAYPAGMGVGDIKLVGAMGIYLGLSVVPAILIAVFTGSLIGLTIIAREGAGARKKAVPFGVFLALGGLVALLVGPDLIELYDDRFLS